MTERDISDPAYPEDLRAVMRKAFGMLTGFYCGYAFRADDVRPLMDEIVRLRARLEEHDETQRTRRSAEERD
jgi:hypothetical protein